MQKDASALYKHAVETGHYIAFSRPEILISDDIELRLQVKESLMIRDLYARSLNNMESSFDLTLWYCTLAYAYLSLLIYKQPKSVKSCVMFCSVYLYTLNCCLFYYLVLISQWERLFPKDCVVFIYY